MPNDAARQPVAERPGRVPAVAVCLVFGVLLVGNSCARPDDWVQTYPDIATRARQEPDALWREARRRWDGLSGMAGSYQVRASRGINSRRLDTQIYLFDDRFFQLEALAPTGSTEGYLVAGETEVGFWTSEENVLYRGAQAPGEFGAALGIDLEPSDIVAVLLGYAVAGPAESAQAVWDAGTRRVRIDAAGGGARAWLHPVTGRIERAEVAGGAGTIEIEYGVLSEGDYPLPLELSIVVPGEEITLRLRLAANWQPNPGGLDARFFDVVVPAGAAVEPLARLGADGGLLRRGLDR